MHGKLGTMEGRSLTPALSRREREIRV